jgi:hypothetical protein
MANMATVEIKAFVPARDFELSKRFYVDLGFEIESLSDDRLLPCRWMWLPASTVLRERARREFHDACSWKT